MTFQFKSKTKTLNNSVTGCELKTVFFLLKIDSRYRSRRRRRRRSLPSLWNGLLNPFYKL